MSKSKEYGSDYSDGESNPDRDIPRIAKFYMQP